MTHITFVCEEKSEGLSDLHQDIGEWKWDADREIHWRISRKGIDVIMLRGEYESLFDGNHSVEEAFEICEGNIAKKKSHDEKLKKSAEEREKAWQDCLAKLDQANPTLSVKDSLAVGNCESGTKTFLKRYGLPEKAEWTDLRKSEKFEEICENHQFLRVLFAFVEKLNTEKKKSTLTPTEYAILGIRPPERNIECDHSGIQGITNHDERFCPKCGKIL